MILHEGWSKLQWKIKLPAARFQFSKEEKFEKKCEKNQIFPKFSIFSQNLEKQVKFATRNLLVKIASENCK